jgi:hypothetical protein
MEPPPHPVEEENQHWTQHLSSIILTITSAGWKAMSIFTIAGRKSMSSIVPRVMVQFICSLLIYLLQDLCLALAYILCRFASHAEDVAMFLEAAKGRTMDGSTRPPVQALASGVIFATSCDVRQAGDSDKLEEVDTETGENSYHGVSLLAGDGARSGVMEARPPLSVLTKREAGLERVRAFHELRKRRGLKV